jgi:hypothetical protein
MYNHKVPTGDPNCPAPIKRAKQLYRRIVEKMDIGDGGGEEDEEYDDDDDDDDDDYYNDDDGDDNGIGYGLELEENNEADEEEQQQEDGRELEEPVPNPIIVQQNNTANVGREGATATNNVGNNGTATNATAPNGSRPPSRVANAGNSRPTNNAKGRNGNDRNLPPTKVRKTSAFSTPIIHSRRTGDRNSTPSTTPSMSGTSVVFQEMMQLMMAQREIDNESDRRRRESEDRRREAEDLRHRQMMDIFMMSMMGGGGMFHRNQQQQQQYIDSPPTMFRTFVPVDNSGVMGQFGVSSSYNSAPTGQFDISSSHNEPANDEPVDFNNHTTNN